MRCIRCGTDGIGSDDEICSSCGAYLPSVFRDLLAPGTQLSGGTYEIEYALGRGGFGVTYRATHKVFDRSVAIKEFYPQDHAHREGATGSLITPSSSQAPYQRWLERFKREGQILFDLHLSDPHPNIVRVQNLFEERSTVYLVMELLEGRTLEDELKAYAGKGLPEARVVEIMNALVGALAKVHARKLYHLDIKPANVMICGDRVVLLDFGAARQELSRSQASSGKSSIAFSENYAPPELMANGELSSATDVFELGMMLHEMLTGQLPPSSLSRFMQHRDWQAELQSPWSEIVNDALRMEVSERPSNVAAWWGRYAHWEKSSSEVSIPLKLEKQPDLKGVKSPSGHGTFSFEVVYLTPEGKMARKQKETAQVYRETLPGDVELEMVWIPGGRFTMGSPSGEVKRQDREGPQHEVKIPGFFLGRYPVTQAQWEAVMGSNPSRFKGANRPVENVSWDDAQEFCKKLSNQTGRSYRLPSEAEWEYGCRAGTTTPFYFGETLSPKVANYDGNSTYGSGPKGEYRNQTTEVGIFPPNGFGMYDMHGNVWEWCQDRWHYNYNGAPIDGRAWESGNEEARIVRGGAWLYDPASCRSADRDWWNPGDRDNDVGFRLALSASGTS